MSTDTRKMSAKMFFQNDRGCDISIATRAALAMMPLDDNVQPGRTFEKAARKFAKQFSKASKRAQPAEIDRLATDTLQRIRAVAVEHGEAYYSTRYDQALSAAMTGGGPTRALAAGERAQPTPSFIASRRGRRTIFVISLLILIAGVAAATIAFFGNTGTSLESPKSNEAAKIFTERKQIPLSKDARRVAGRFILTAVARKSLGESYELTHPELRQGLSKKEWLTGNIPVTYYPADQLQTATFKVDESYPDEAILEVALLPKKNVKIEPQIFFIGLKKIGKGAEATWKVSYWVPRVPLQIPNARD